MNGIWDPKKLNVNCNGRDVSGMSQSDGFFKIEPVTKEYILSQVGIKGDWNISEIYDGRVKLSIALMGDSPENEFFSQWVKNVFLVYLRLKIKATAECSVFPHREEFGKGQT